MRLVRLAAAAMMVLGLAASASANVVALKRDPGLSFAVDIAGDGTVDADSITPVKYQTATVYSGAAGDATVYRDGGGKWNNYGASPILPAYHHFQLFQYDLEAAPGLVGGTINEAILRYSSRGGNHGGVRMGPVRTYPWAEGNKTGSAPGGAPAMPGVSHAHPAGLNTGANQGPGGPGTAPNQTWGDGNDFFWPDPGTGWAPVDGVHPGDGSIADEIPPTSTGYLGGDYSRWWNADITAIVQDWVDGTEANFGTYLLRRVGTPPAPLDHNWNIMGSEQAAAPYGPAWEVQPVLFIDYEPREMAPIPEPAGLSLMGLALLAIRRKRS